AHGCYEGRGVEDQGIRGMFARESLLASEWYRERLRAKEGRGVELWRGDVGAGGEEGAVGGGGGGWGGGGGGGGGWVGRAAGGGGVVGRVIWRSWWGRLGRIRFAGRCNAIYAQRHAGTARVRRAPSDFAMSTTVW